MTHTTGVRSQWGESVDRHTQPKSVPFPAMPAGEAARPAALAERVAAPSVPRPV